MTSKCDDVGLVSFCLIAAASASCPQVLYPRFQDHGCRHSCFTAAPSAPQHQRPQQYHRCRPRERCRLLELRVLDLTCCVKITDASRDHCFTEKVLVPQILIAYTPAEGFDLRGCVCL